MVQESTMICVDNSEWMRNGDLPPTRLQCEQEAAHLIVQCKLRSNPENAVGLLTMADDVRVLSTMTSEERKLYIKLHEINVEGSAKFINSIKVAHLALKHRQNRNHKMRIVIFIGSPIDGIDSSELIKMGKKLKKEKVNIDVVCFGEATAETNQVISDFIDTLNGKEGTGSNMVVVSAGAKLREALAQSPICRGEDGNGVVPGAGGFEFGIDAEDDPELALALRVSLEEQRARQRQEGGQDESMQIEGGAPVVEQAAEPSRPQVDNLASMDPASMTEEEQLQWALRMSMMQDAGNFATEARDIVLAEASVAKVEEQMDVDQSSADDLITDANQLQQLVDQIPEAPSDKKKDDVNKSE